MRGEGSEEREERRHGIGYIRKKRRNMRDVRGELREKKQSKKRKDILTSLHGDKCCIALQ